MKITLLGTGTSQGVPVIGCQCAVCQSANPKDKRLRTSAMIEWKNSRIIIDCGPDFRPQMLREKVAEIDAILFTHEHADHTAGLDDIRPIYFRKGAPLPIYALKRVMDNLEKRFDYIFTRKNRYPGAPEVEKNILKAFENFHINGKEIIPLEVMHGNLPILGYKINNFAYLTDAKTLPEKTIEELQNLDLLIVNALHHKPHKMHMNLKESLALIAKIQPRKAVLIHISHYMGLYEEVPPQLPDNVILGYDGMQLEI